jgi:hypothetical protein
VTEDCLNPGNAYILRVALIVKQAEEVCVKISTGDIVCGQLVSKPIETKAFRSWKLRMVRIVVYRAVT